MNRKKCNTHILKSSISGQGGQSLILALVVMFFLAFIGGIFATLIARNMGRTARSGQVMTSDYLAESGVRYASDQLTYSEDGADWRPAPSYPDVVKALSDGTDPTASTVVQPLKTDPDYHWLMLGFSRFTCGDGQFLLRVTYDPKPNDPMSKFIKIESVGHTSVVDPNDPTTMNIGQPSRQRSVKVAYKALGITDYARFVTNKDRRPDDISLGTPGFVTTFGAGTMTPTPTATQGAPIRVNGNLTWNGTNYIWLLPNHPADSVSDRVGSDGVEVAGEIKYATLPYSGVTGTLGAHPVPNWTTGAPCTYINGHGALDSNAQASLSDGSTVNGFDSDPEGYGDIGRYRDGSSANDFLNRPRNITRIEPPLIDGTSATGGFSRYRDLTRNSGDWKADGNGGWYNTGYYGYGNGLYINNPGDIQQESSMSTLRGNWTDPGSRYWNGPYYTPPGINIVLTPYDLKGDGSGPHMILTHDGGPDLPEFQWYGPDGKVIAPDGERIVMPYPKNGVIFAEGNIRIKGTLPAGRQLTVVSGGTIYVEGNILKCPFDSTGAVWSDQGSNSPTAKNSSIALLATDYICVNTTQFFAPTRDSLMAGAEGGYFDIGPNRSFWMNYSYGADPTNYRDSSGTKVPVDLNLLVRHAKDPGTGSCFINMLLNYPPSTTDSTTDPYYAFYRFRSNSATTDYAYPGPTNGVSFRAAPNWEETKFTLCDSGGTLPNNSKYHLYSNPGVFNTIGFQLDQTQDANLSADGLQDYYLSRAAVVPCDIRIEALLYAQNKSFFVIPGEWFNPDPSDTPANYLATGKRPDGVASPDWPYYGEPLDVKIVIYGAVSENISASIGDSSAWMEKWGWIPAQHGCNTSATTTAYRTPLDSNNANGPRQGLTFIYDGELSYPRTPSDPADLTKPWVPVRQEDYYHRTLPALPRLPVSSQLLYFGSPT